MGLVCLFRRSLAEDNEFDIASKHMRVVTQRSQCVAGDLVIGRYSVLPWYRELYEDLKIQGALLLQTPSQHYWISDMTWAFDGTLEGLTFPTWSRLEEVQKNDGPFVLKGRTNSKKQDWNGSMFAESWADAVRIEGKLSSDGLIGDQGIVIRKYIPLVTYFRAIGGLPITKEFRIFVFNNKVVSKGFYWHAFSGDFEVLDIKIPSVECIPEKFLNEVIERISKSDNAPVFYVIDIAEDLTGRWWVVEINDGQMSGLSDNDPEVLYSELASLGEECCHAI